MNLAASQVLEDLDAPYIKDATPLATAAIHGLDKSARALLSCGADVNHLMMVGLPAARKVSSSSFEVSHRLPS